MKGSVFWWILFHVVFNYTRICTPLFSYFIHTTRQMFSKLSSSESFYHFVSGLTNISFVMRLEIRSPMLVNPTVWSSSVNVFSFYKSVTILRIGQRFVRNFILSLSLFAYVLVHLFAIFLFCSYLGGGLAVEINKKLKALNSSRFFTNHRLSW